MGSIVPFVLAGIWAYKLTSLLEDDVDGRSGRDGRDLSGWHENRPGCQLAGMGLLAVSDLILLYSNTNYTGHTNPKRLERFLPKIFTTASQDLCCTPCFTLLALTSAHQGTRSFEPRLAAVDNPHCVDAKLL